MAFPGRPLLFESLDEVFARRWIGFSEDRWQINRRGRKYQAAEPPPVSQRVMNRRGDRTT